MSNRPANKATKDTGPRTPPPAGPSNVPGSVTPLAPGGNHLTDIEPWTPKPPQPYSPQLSDLPNYEKLTNGERWIQSTLGGISAGIKPIVQTVGGYVAKSPVGQALAAFDPSWAGKALSVLDTGAEAVERSTGLAAQWLHALGNPEEMDDFQKNLGAAWYAGSLSADMANILPIYENGRWEMPTDLPGVDGLIAARQKIAMLAPSSEALAADIANLNTWFNVFDPNRGPVLRQYSQALAQVRDEYYGSEGALALRSQIQDATFHILADPLQVALEWVKPVELVQKARIGVLANKIYGVERGAVEVAGVVGKLTEAETQLADALKVLDTAQLAGKAEEAAAASRRVAELSGAVDAARTAASEAVRGNLNWGEQLLVKFTGGDPFKPGKIRGAWWNPFDLTPQARALEYINVVQNNIDAHIIPGIMHNGIADVDEFVNIIQRTADGTVSPELGHMIVTVEGRHLRGTLQTVKAGITDLHAAFTRLGEFERPLLTLMAEGLGESRASILARLEGGEAEALLAQLMRHAEFDPAYAQRLTGLLGEQGIQALSLSEMERLKAVFTGDVPKLFSEGAFMMEARNLIADSAARTGIAQFGVKSRGFFTSAAEMVKAAESLAFLRLNPGYPVRNFINNTFTMIARGSFGLDSMESITGFWNKLGFSPGRLAEGVGQAEILAALERGGVGGSAEALGVGAGVVTKAVKGEGFITDKVGDFFKNISLGKLDAGQAAASIEKMASRQAYTTFYKRGYPGFIKSFLGKVGDVSPGLYDELGPQLSKQVENIIHSSWTPAEMEAKLFKGGNLNLNMPHLLEQAEGTLGRPVSQALNDVLPHLQDELVRAAESGNRTAVRDVMGRIGNQLDNHIQSLADDSLAVLRDEAFARVSTEGPQGFAGVWASVADDVNGAMERHAMDMAEHWQQVSENADPAVMRVLHQKNAADSSAFFGRMWDRLDSRMQGMADAARDLKLGGASEIVTESKNWRKGWQDFFEFRENSLNEFFEARAGGKVPKRSFPDIQAELNTRYEGMLRSEYDITRRLDERLAGLIPEEQRGMFLRWRERVADLRLQDRTSVFQFRERIQGMPGNLRGAAWEEHWGNRRLLWSQIHAEEKNGLAALMGNQEAAAIYGPAVEGAGEMPVSLASVAEQAPLASGEQAVEGAKKIVIDIDENLRAQQFAEATDNPFFRDLRARSQILRRQALEERLAEEAEKAAQAANVTDNATTATDLWAYTTEEIELRKKLGFWADDPQAEAEAAARAKRKGISSDASINEGTTPLVNTTDEAVAPDVNQAVPANATQATAQASENVPEEVLPTIQPQGAGFMPDYHQVVPRQEQVGIALDQFMYTRGHDELRALEEATYKTMDSRPLKFENLSEQAQAGLRGYIEHARGAMGDARYAALKFGEYGRDSSLLNYSRRYNYNAWLGHVLPYEFWVTQSMFNWAVHSIDRPAMLSTYLKVKKFLNTAYRPETGLPSRFKGQVRIPMPFMPDWMGHELFFDPLKTALPFDGFMGIAEQLQASENRNNQATQRQLGALLNDGSISQSDYDQALQGQSGPVWERAQTLAQQQSQTDQPDAFDLMSAMSSPHAPLVWAYNAARGKTDEIGPFLPMTRTIKGVTAMLGIGPAGGLNIEGAVRRELGLPAFDKWDEFRTERMVTNMVGAGEISSADGIRALMDKNGPIWEEATRKAGKEWGTGVVTGLLGLPAHPYPEGEENLRQLSDDYSAAWQKYKDGDDEAIKRFNIEHPEYEARLYLFKKPEERMRRFMVDEMWNRWNEMPDVHKHEVAEQLGKEFQDSFLNKETRSYDAIPLDTLGVWLKLAGGSPPGSLNVPNVPPLDLAPADIAHRAQVFYDMRDQQYPDWKTQQNEYFDLPAGKGRKAYLAQHPDLSRYFRWRGNFLKSNPDAAQYLTDNPPPKPEHEQNPQFSWAEWQTAIPNPALMNLIEDYAHGEALPKPALARLKQYGDELGWQGSELELAQTIAAEAPK